jgi:aminoglycoside phosphotransferase (APT) family kinase protein
MARVAIRMHEDQVDVRPATVARLVGEQFPRWRPLPVRPLTSYGTVNALFRLGDDLVARFPLQPSLDGERRLDLEREQAYATLLQDHVDIEVPVPEAVGAPGPGYDGFWSVWRWVEGTTAEPQRVRDQGGFGRDLADLVRAVRDIPHDAGPVAPPRRPQLADCDDGVRATLAAHPDAFDVRAVLEEWERSLAAPRQDALSWVHGDLMPGNLLLRRGRLAGLIDLGSTGRADPALDVRAARNTLNRPGRRAFLEALSPDPATVQRSRGWALLQAVAALPYYVHTNRVMHGMAARTLAALLTEPESQSGSVSV